MADSVCAPTAGSLIPATTAIPRHSAVVRLTHWITALCFLALLVSGIEILISHPRFYWGEAGNVLTPPLFKLPIPSSRATVPTGYGYVLPDQNGWSRYLHFQAAWLAVLTGLTYFVYGSLTGHFRRNLLPARAAGESEDWSYNTLQRRTYLFVIFVLFPLAIWTGLAMSPAWPLRFLLPSRFWVASNPRARSTFSFRYFSYSSFSSTSSWSVSPDSGAAWERC